MMVMLVTAATRIIVMMMLMVVIVTAAAFVIMVMDGDARVPRDRDRSIRHHGRDDGALCSS